MNQTIPENPRFKVNQHPQAAFFVRRPSPDTIQEWCVLTDSARDSVSSRAVSDLRVKVPSR
jgi:hypothetical protein